MVEADVTGKVIKFRWADCGNTLWFESFPTANLLVKSAVDSAVQP